MVKRRLDDAQETYCRNYNKRVKYRPFTKGALVLYYDPKCHSNVKPNKFHPYFEHLYKVEEEVGNDVRVCKVWPPLPKTRHQLLPKDQLKLFQGTIPQYTDAWDGVEVPPDDDGLAWSTLLWNSQHKGTQPETEEEAEDRRAGTVDWSEKTWCPVCNRDSDSTKDADHQIQCDHCLNWFHFDCVNIQEAPPEEMEYFCPTCVGPSNQFVKRQTNQVADVAT